MISIIVTAYNLEKYIKICIKSLQAQTYENIEIICIDDGSTDNTPNIIKDLAKTDSRIKYHYHENKGVGFSRNKGLELAQGEYILFIDGDDWVDNELCQKTIEIAKKCNSDIVFFDVANIDNPTKIIRKQNFFEADAWKNHLNKFSIHTYKDNNKIYNGNFSAANKLFNKAFLQKHELKFCENLRFEDYLFYFQSFLLAKKINLLPEKLYFYRTNRENSMITTLAKQTDVVFDIFEIFKLLETFLKEQNLFEQLKTEFFILKLKNYKTLFFNTKSQFRKKFYNLIQQDINTLSLSANEFSKLGKYLSIYQEFKIYNCATCYFVYSLQNKFPKLTKIIDILKDVIEAGQDEQ